MIWMVNGLYGYVVGHILGGFLECKQKVSSKRNLNKMHQNHFKIKGKIEIN